MSGCSQKVAKKPFKNLTFQICKFPLSLVEKKPVFSGALKFKYLWNRLAKFEKTSPFWNSLITGFQMMQKSNNFDQVSISADLPTSGSRRYYSDVNLQRV